MPSLKSKNKFKDKWLVKCWCGDGRDCSYYTWQTVPSLIEWNHMVIAYLTGGLDLRFKLKEKI